MTVFHGLRPGYQTTEARQELLERAVATTDGAEYLAILRGVADRDWFGFHAALLLRVGVGIVRELVDHRQAKCAALIAEDRRRRDAALRERSLEG